MLIPKPIKNLILAFFWKLKQFWEDWQDFSAELIGYVPIHVFRLWWLKSINRMQIGKHSSIHRKCRMYFPHRIRIGKNSIVNYGVLLDGRRRITIGDNVSISEGVVILTLGHDIDDPNFSLQGEGVVIEDYVFIGSYALILPGVKLGKGSVVGAGSVVTRSVDPFTLVAGNPARFIRKRSSNLIYSLNHRKRFG